MGSPKAEKEAAKCKEEGSRWRARLGSEADVVNQELIWVPPRGGAGLGRRRRNRWPSQNACVDASSERCEATGSEELHSAAAASSSPTSTAGPGIMLLIYDRTPSYVPSKILSIEVGKPLKSFRHLLHRNKKVDFIERFNEKLLVKQEDENFQIVDNCCCMELQRRACDFIEDHLLWHDARWFNIKSEPVQEQAFNLQEQEFEVFEQQQQLPADNGGEADFNDEDFDPDAPY